MQRAYMKFMQRLFVSVNVTSPEVVERIKALQRELGRFGDGIKLTEPENLHFTLKFIGEVDDRTADEVSRRLSEIRYRRFSVEIRGLGYFPGGSHVRVVWVGAEGDGLRGLAEEVRARLRGIGEEEFVAHLTIARVKWIKDPSSLISWIAANSGARFGTIEVSEFYLMKSTLLPSGPVYTPVARYELS